MKRLVFAALIMAYSVSWADWEYTDKSYDGVITFYHDKSTIRKNGSLAKMWVMHSSSVEQSDGADSFKTKKILWSFNCREVTAAWASILTTSGEMGGGRVVLSGTRKDGEMDWFALSPDSVGMVQLKIACGKK